MDFFARTVIIGKASRWPQCIAGTALLLFTFANLLRVVHWYLRRFLGLGMHKAGGEAGLEIDEDALREPYNDENAFLLPPHGDEDGLPESYGNDLLGLAYREQQEGTRHQTDSSKMNKFSGKDTDEKNHDSQPKRSHDNDEPPPASAIRTSSPFLTDDYGEGPSALGITPPPPRQGDPLQVGQPEPHPKPISFHPRFR